MSILAQLLMLGSAWLALSLVGAVLAGIWMRDCGRRG